MKNAIRCCYGPVVDTLVGTSDEVADGNFFFFFFFLIIKNNFRCRDLNPGLSGESRVS